MKKILLATMMLGLLAAFGLTSTTLAEDSSDAVMTWTGEVIDIACYIPKGAKGEAHAGCAKSCVKNGQPMGLLTDDGVVYLLTADHKDGAPFEALKDLAGENASVTGSLAEKGGMKMINVTGSKAAA
ncbi:MAG: hypothetical protein K0U98_02680 [Deltaproteobacteria bacterium]|nr:hypothetical protein [Deltaproteobacteria bacterium]